LLEYVYNEILNPKYRKKYYSPKILYFFILLGAFIMSILLKAWQYYTVQTKYYLIVTTTFLIFSGIITRIFQYFCKKTNEMKNRTIYMRLLIVLIIVLFCVFVFWFYTTDILLAYFKIDYQLLTRIQQYLT